jgi:hypothetical protein
MDGAATQTGTLYGTWARLLGRGFGLELAHCPLCLRGTLRLIAVITQGAVSRKLLRQLQLAADPPSSAPARTRQESDTFA